VYHLPACPGCRAPYPTGDPMTPACTAWVTRLAPYARDGYRTGWLTDHEVVLFGHDGAEVRIPRPQGGWLAASLVVPALDAQDLDAEELRGIVYVMQRRRERMELTV
jgi:hypothetical protein